MKEKILKFITSKFFVLGIQLLATIAVVYFTFKLDLVPTKYLIAGIVVLALLLAGFFGIIYSSEQKIKKGLSSKRGIVKMCIRDRYICVLLSSAQILKPYNCEVPY